MSKYLNLLMLIVLTLILSSFASAIIGDTYFTPIVEGDSSLLYGIFKQNQNVTLVQNCIDSTYANITRVIYPNSTIILDGQYGMTKVGDNYYYVFANTSMLGYYHVYGECDYVLVGNVYNATWGYYFKVTKDGIDDSLIDETSSMSLIFFMLFIIIGLFTLGFWKKFTPWEIVNLCLGRGCFVVAIMLMMYTTTLLLNIVTYANMDILSKEMVFLMTWLGWAGYIAAVYLVIQTLFDILRIKKERKKKKIYEVEE